MTENKNCTGAEMCKRAFERYEEKSNPFIRYCDHIIKKQTEERREKEAGGRGEKEEEKAESTFGKR